MPDKKIIFTASAEYRQVAGVTVYEAGSIHTMREDLANRWIMRGLATDDAAAIAATEAAKAPPPPVIVEPPADDPPQRGRRGAA